jgi:hypothetical protein
MGRMHGCHTDVFGRTDGWADGRWLRGRTWLGCTLASFLKLPGIKQGPSARTRPCVRADALLRSWVNADAGGHPDDVHGRPDEKDIRTDIFIQKRPLWHPWPNGSYYLMCTLKTTSKTNFYFYFNAFSSSFLQTDIVFDTYVFFKIHF